MTLKFEIDNIEYPKELQSIVNIELKNHFENRANFLIVNDYVLVQINEEDYFNDIEKAKEQFYNEHKDYLTDFVSEVQENLSVVTRVSIYKAEQSNHLSAYCKECENEVSNTMCKDCRLDYQNGTPKYYKGNGMNIPS